MKEEVIAFQMGSSRLMEKKQRSKWIKYNYILSWNFVFIRTQILHWKIHITYHMLLLLLSLLFLIIIIVELHPKPVEPRDREQSGFMGRDATYVN